jgi:uncharacterized membrane protein YeaQ/YmgE (transglycosylase-associated protein family)
MPVPDWLQLDALATSPAGFESASSGLAHGANHHRPRENAMMSWIWTILIGFVAGLIARWVTPGGGPSGFWITAILGILGAIVATFIGQMMGFYGQGEPAGFIASVLGAVVLLVLYHLFTRTKTTSQ